ncbi:hypothetical protein IPJ72_02685 [Candidatus Peregrinibacteria bacterium]|nr:MAG: hypothetical protein IPJ72_02685 [Candidatus Peregrinibacteria bacterium]
MAFNLSLKKAHPSLLYAFAFALGVLFHVALSGGATMNGGYTANVLTGKQDVNLNQQPALSLACNATNCDVIDEVHKVQKKLGNGSWTLDAVGMDVQRRANTNQSLLVNLYGHNGSGALSSWNLEALAQHIAQYGDSSNFQSARIRGVNQSGNLSSWSIEALAQLIGDRCR